MANLTYLDLAKRLDPDNKVAAIAEVLAQTNEILDDMVVVEGNLPTGHKTTIRTGYPSATWRMFNYGVQPDKSTTKQVTDVIGMLEAYSETDKDLALLNGNVSEFRFSEDKAFIESMNIEMAKALFYGNTLVTPEKFTGLAPRYNSISTDENLIGYNVIDAGGTGTDNTSVYLVVWGDDTVFGTYPKGSQLGLIHEDLGEVTKVAADGSLHQIYRTHYQWKLGLTVKNWKYVVRIANIDYSDFMAGTGADLVKYMIQATEMIPSLNAGNPVFYMRRDVRTALRNQIRSDSNVRLTFDTVAGKRVAMFDEIPVRRVDQIVTTETRVV